jgi:uncharacterized protein (TIGR02246 family)
MSKEHQYTSTNNNDNLLRNKVAAEQDLIGIKNLIDQFVDAWNKHDAKLFAVLFEDDSEWTDVIGHLMVGKEEIERMHAYPFTTVLKDAILTVKSIRTKEIQSGVVSVDAVWESTGSKTPEGKPLPTRLGLMTLIVKKDDPHNKTWSIVIGHNLDYTGTYTNSDRKKIVGD